MARMRDKKRAKRTIFIPDLSKVEGRVTVPEGDYRVKVDEITEHEGNVANYYKWSFEIIEGDYKGKKLFYNTSLAEQSLWNLRSLLESLGIDDFDGDMELDLEDLIGRELMVTVEHDSYEGKKQAKVVDFTAIADDDEEEEEEEEEDPKAKKRRERRERRKMKKSSKSSGEDEDEEEDEKPKKSKKKSELDKEEILDMNEDELIELCEEHELDVDLDEFKTLRKKKNAVIDAAEEAGLL